MEYMRRKDASQNTQQNVTKTEITTEKIKYKNFINFGHNKNDCHNRTKNRFVMVFVMVQSL